MKKPIVLPGLDPSRYKFLPEEALALLPFRNQSLKSWPLKTDLFRFVNLVGDGSYSVLESDIEDMQELADDFAPDSSEPKVNFLSSSRFGGMAKAIVAFRKVLSDLLAEGAFSSLSHSLEIEADLNASLLLASNYYYKQACSCLRACQESAIKSVYWAVNYDKFPASPSSGGFRKINGPNGYIFDLAKNSIITPNFKEELEQTYKHLNGSIHSDEKQMIHSGLKTGHWRGHRFSAVKCRDYFKIAKQVAEQCIRLFGLQSQYRLKTIRDDVLFCSICHAQTGISVKPAKGWSEPVN